MGKIHYARLAPMAKNHDEKKAWDFLVYLAGDNDLSEEMVWSLQEMNQAALEPVFHERIGLVALFDPAGGEPVRYDLTARRKRVKNDRGGLSSVGVVDRTLQRSEEVVQLVARFLIGAFGEPPRSTNRGVILSGHGSGALGDFLDDRNPPNGELGIPTLGRILRDIRDRSGSGIQILGLDSCQMSTIEVGYEVRDFVRYLVASEGPVANTGWPYRQVLQGVAENADAKPVVAARAVANRYLAFYRDYEIAPQSTDIAVTELSALGAVAGGVRDLAYALGEPLSRIAAHGLEELHELDGTTPAPAIADARAIRNAIVLAHWSAQSYKCDRYTDLRDFTEQLLRFLPSEGSLTEKVRHCSRRLLGTIDTAVMLSG
ncbi:MAG: clostripain-related cysteine peptidase, partial [Vicinamibacteria bacterium]